MATPPVDDGLRHRLREARRGVGKTQQEVATALGVTRRAVSEWEGGQRRPHSALPDLAKLYGVSTSYLLTGAEEASIEVRELRRTVDELYEIVNEFIRQTTTNFEAVLQLLGEEDPADPKKRWPSWNVEPRATRATARSRRGGQAQTRPA